MKTHKLSGAKINSCSECSEMYNYPRTQFFYCGWTGDWIDKEAVRILPSTCPLEEFIDETTSN